MTSLNLPPFRFVSSSGAWHDCLARLRREKQIALDMEANSLYAYRERVCLIQISIPSDDYILDPTVGLDLTGLGQLIEDPSVEKILHSGEYDLMMLRRDYGWQMANLFDTMWAARILGYERMGLANILQDKYNVQLDKRYQKANWCRRPLPRAQLVYAQTDTHYLLRLRADLARSLREQGHWDEAQELFAEQCKVEPSDTSFDPDGFWSITGVHKLSRRQQAVLKAVYLYREREAERQNRPPFKVLGTKTLLELAQLTPQTNGDLGDVYGMTSGQIRRYGLDILNAIAAGMADPLPTRPRRDGRPPDSVINRYERLHAWRKKRASARGVESDVILSRGSMWDMAHTNPRSMEELEEIESLGPWRRKTYGDELLALLKAVGS